MTRWITSIIESFSYGGIVFLMCLENVFPPIPSELIMPLAGFVSTRGELSFPGVVLAGTLGSVLGALPLYYLGYWMGAQRLHQWLDRRGRWVGLSSGDLTKAQRWFDRHGGKTVLLCRLVPGVRSFISVPAGITRMNLPVFLVYTAIGSAGWTCALAWAGRQLGRNYHAVERFVGPISVFVMAAIFAWVVVRALGRGARGAPVAPGRP